MKKYMVRRQINTASGTIVVDRTPRVDVSTPSPSNTLQSTQQTQRITELQAQRSSSRLRISEIQSEIQELERLRSVAQRKRDKNNIDRQIAELSRERTRLDQSQVRDRINIERLRAGRTERRFRKDPVGTDATRKNLKSAELITQEAVVFQPSPRIRPPTPNPEDIAARAERVTRRTRAFEARRDRAFRQAGIDRLPPGIAQDVAAIPVTLFLPTLQGDSLGNVLDKFLLQQQIKAFGSTEQRNKLAQQNVRQRLAFRSAVTNPVNIGIAAFGAVGATGAITTARPVGPTRVRIVGREDVTGTTPLGRNVPSSSVRTRTTATQNARSLLDQALGRSQRVTQVTTQKGTRILRRDVLGPDGKIQGRVSLRTTPEGVTTRTVSKAQGNKLVPVRSQKVPTRFQEGQALFGQRVTVFDDVVRDQSTRAVISGRRTIQEQPVTVRTRDGAIFRQEQTGTATTRAKETSGIRVLGDSESTIIRGSSEVSLDPVTGRIVRNTRTLPTQTTTEPVSFGTGGTRPIRFFRESANVQDFSVRVFPPRKVGETRAVIREPDPVQFFRQRQFETTFELQNRNVFFFDRNFRTEPRTPSSPRRPLSLAIRGRRAQASLENPINILRPSVPRIRPTTRITPRIRGTPSGALRARPFGATTRTPSPIAPVSSLPGNLGEIPRGVLPEITLPVQQPRDLISPDTSTLSGTGFGFGRTSSSSLVNTPTPPSLFPNSRAIPGGDSFFGRGLFPETPEIGARNGRKRKTKKGRRTFRTSRSALNVVFGVRGIDPNLRDISGLLVRG